jgi:hypothetical protein
MTGEGSVGHRIHHGVQPTPPSTNDTTSASISPTSSFNAPEKSPLLPTATTEELYQSLQAVSGPHWSPSPQPVSTSGQSDASVLPYMIDKLYQMSSSEAYDNIQGPIADAIAQSQGQGMTYMSNFLLQNCTTSFIDDTNSDIVRDQLPLQSSHSSNLSIPNILPNTP